MLLLTKPHPYPRAFRNLSGKDFPQKTDQEEGLEKNLKKCCRKCCQLTAFSRAIPELHLRWPSDPQCESGRFVQIDSQKSTQIRRVPKSEFFECAFGPLSSHPFSLISPPLSPASPVHFPTTSPLFTFPFIPPFLTPGKLRFRYPSDLGTL